MRKHHYSVTIHPLFWTTWFYQKIGAEGWTVQVLCFTIQKRFYL